MMKNLPASLLQVVIVILFIITNSFAQSPGGGGWAQKGSHVEAREGAVGFAIGTKGYIAFGNFGGSTRGSLWEFDPATGWTQKANGSNRQYAVAVVVNGKAYVGTGEDVTFTRDSKWFEYNPATNIWTAKTNFAGGPRTEAVGFSIGTKGYVGTGFDGALRKDFWEYNAATNAWTQVADFGGTARRGAVAFAIGEKGYVGTGNDGAKKKDFWEYDPTLNSWTQKVDFAGTAREGAVAFTVNNKGYIATGDDGLGKNDIWEYNPNTNTWIVKATAPVQFVRRYVAAAFAIGNSGYIGTGFSDATSTGAPRSDFWEFQPVKVPDAPSNVMVSSFSEKTMRLRWKDNSNNEVGFTIYRSTNNIDFASIGSVGADIATYEVTGLTSGQLYYYYVKAENVDGFSIPSPTVSQVAERYETGIWTRLQDIPATLRINDVPASFTIDDNIYFPIVDLYLNPGALLTPATWVYNTTNDTWTQKADFTGTLRQKATAFTQNGKGYLGLGLVNSPNTLLNDFWIYDPAVNTWTQKNNFPGQGRYGAFAFVIGSKAYVGSGNNLLTNLTDFWEYNFNTDTWLQKANLTQGAFDYNSFASMGKGYVGLSTFNRSLYEYNPGTDTWAVKSEFPSNLEISYSRLVSLNNGKAFLVFYNNITSKVIMWEYQVSNDRWIELPLTPINRSTKGPFVASGTTAYYGLGSFSGDWYSYTSGVSIPLPSNFKAEIVDDTKIDVSWEGSSADIFKLYRSGASDGAYALVATISGATSYRDNIDATTPVYYKIQAENAQGTSKLSEPVEAFKQGLWKPMANINPYIPNGVAAGLSTKGYFGIGFAYSASDENNKVWWEYDPATNQWTQKSSFPGESRNAATVFTANDFVYVGLGKSINSNLALKDFWQYNPTTNIWTKKADFAGAERYEAPAVSLGSKAYVFAGLKDQDNYFQDTWEYNADNDAWTERAAMPGLPKRGVLALPINGGVLVAGGSTKSGNAWSASREHFFFDPSSNTWTNRKPLPYTYSFYTASFTLNGKVYAYLYANNKNRLCEYVPATQQWIIINAISEIATNAFVIGSRAFIIEERKLWEFIEDDYLASPSNLTSNYENGKVTLNWEDESSAEENFIIESTRTNGAVDFQILKEVQSNTTATEVAVEVENANYFFRVRAKKANGGLSKASNIVIENTGPYWAKQSINFQHRTGAIAFAINDKVYYGLGSQNNEYKKDFWSWDPTSNTWTQQAPFPGAGRNNPATFVMNNQGYVFRGATYQGEALLTDLWRYNPSTNIWTLLPTSPGSFGNTPFVAIDENNVYIGMGSTSNSFSKEIWLFDAANEAWRRLPDFPEDGRRNVYAFAANHKLIIGGGASSSTLNPATVWELDLATEQWLAKKNAPQGIRDAGNEDSDPVQYFKNGNVGYFFAPNRYWCYYFSEDSWSYSGSNVGASKANKVAYQSGKPFGYLLLKDNAAGSTIWQFNLIPLVPTLSKASVVPTASMQLEWFKMITLQDSVVIYRSENQNGAGFEEIARVSKADTFYIDKNLSPNKTYYYRLRQKNQAGSSAFSNTVYNYLPPIPPTPLDFRATITENIVTANWSSSISDPNQKFVLEKSIGTQGQFIAIDTLTTFSRNDTLTDKGSVFYRIFAYNVSGASPMSNVVAIVYVGISDDLEGLNVFPVPTTGRVSIEVDPSFGNYSVSVVTLAGKELLRVNNSPKELDLTNQPTGIYLLTIKNSKGRGLLIKKLIKQ